MPLSDDTLLGLANRFTVVVDGHDLGSYAKCEGLDVAWEVADYRAGDNGNDHWYFPGVTKYSSIKLTRAACKDSEQVKSWLSETSNKHKPGTGTITLFDSHSEKVMSWNLRAVMPTKWAITSFEAGASKVAQETLELEHMGFLDDEFKLG